MWPQEGAAASHYRGNRACPGRVLERGGPSGDGRDRGQACVLFDHEKHAHAV